MLYLIVATCGIALGIWCAWWYAKEQIRDAKEDNMAIVRTRDATIRTLVAQNEGLSETLKIREMPDDEKAVKLSTGAILSAVGKHGTH